jgi:hypothetical protein
MKISVRKFALTLCVDRRQEFVIFRMQLIDAKTYPKLSNKWVHYYGYIIHRMVRSIHFTS